MFVLGVITLLSCISPKYQPGKLQLILTTNNSVDTYVAERIINSIFTFTLHAYIATIQPMIAMSDGGTTLTITGGNFVFNPFLTCRFGHNTVVATYHNQNSIQCVVPSLEIYDRSNSTAVEVANNGVDLVTFIKDSMKLEILN